MPPGQRFGLVVVYAWMFVLPASLLAAFVAFMRWERWPRHGRWGLPLMLVGGCTAMSAGNDVHWRASRSLESLRRFAESAPNPAPDESERTPFWTGWLHCGGYYRAHGTVVIYLSDGLFFRQGMAYAPAYRANPAEPPLRFFEGLSSLADWRDVAYCPENK